MIRELSGFLTKPRADFPVRRNLLWTSGASDLPFPGKGLGMVRMGRAHLLELIEQTRCSFGENGWRLSLQSMVSCQTWELRLAPGESRVNW
ncbi:MAG: hypothetical protein CMF59_06330 [Leptospiraceae bacterium]|nr:hypothetical protein [Leptospiraceae bacterium]